MCVYVCERYSVHFLSYQIGLPPDQRPDRSINPTIVPFSVIIPSYSSGPLWCPLWHAQISYCGCYGYLALSFASPPFEQLGPLRKLLLGNSTFRNSAATHAFSKITKLSSQLNLGTFRIRFATSSQVILLEIWKRKPLV